ncbi:HNH endonuclease [Arthrobacter saudimassiliensis]|uniref:HNH endonuclease n=1 Tax=Arthrobacter saudimassiliensis TaxID=1461584 RepID=A0A078MNF1_9MICC|nr:HNH endonuclease [Arthrobacter saudimassiliensis]
MSGAGQAVAELIDVLGRASVPDAELVDALRGLEDLKASAAAGQALAAVRLDASQRRAQEAAGVPRGQLGRVVGAQVALARRDSPARGGRHLGLAKALVTELPCTLAGLAAGRISEWRATLIARETACLDPADRAEVDRLIAGNLDEVERLGDRRLIGRLRRHTYRLDPRAVVNRARKAEAERYVSLRPAPDTMCWLTALLPVAQGVAVYAALSRAADSARSHAAAHPDAGGSAGAGGQPRSRGQVMADTLIERITGRDPAQPPRMEVQLVITDRTLLHGDNEPALLHGYDTVPAPWARDLVGSALAAATGPMDPGGTTVTTPKTTTAGQPADAPTARGRPRQQPSPDLTLRRLYTAPGTGELIAMDSRARAFPPGLARFIISRDQHCRTPWCGAPIRHIDHAEPYAQGGRTTASNGQGLCENCNYAKQAPGWRSRSGTAMDTLPGGTTPLGNRSKAGPSGDSAGVKGKGGDGKLNRTELTTPTGHRYVSALVSLPE